MARAEQAGCDKALRCASCGDTWVFTSGEQELFRLRGVAGEPEQCPTCARGRVLAGVRRERAHQGD